MDRHEQALERERKIHTVLEVIQQSSNVKRYSSRFMHTPESLMEHMGFTCLFCYVVARQLRDQKVHVVISDLMEKAVLHDVEEKLTGDIIRQTKHSSPQVRDGINEHSVRAVHRLEELFGFSFVSTWATAKDDSLEGRIVALADMAAVVSKCMVEVGMLGNQAFASVVRNTHAELRKWYIDTHINDPLYQYVEGMFCIMDKLRHNIGNYGEFSQGF
jgi:5'-deoxynucleotidase YfbR-like HD superfamily hydrolase